MKRTMIKSLTTISFVCIALVLMCAFFIEESHASVITSGTTTRKEQTVKISLKKGTCLITVKDVNSWVYSHVQTTGGNKFGKALNGDMLLTQVGQERSYTVPIRKAGTYYLYLHGVNAGATYNVQHFKSYGKLKNGVPRLCTSFADNKTWTFYTIEVPGTGKLTVKATDASPRYRGYSKIKLKTGKTLLSGEEHLIRGLGFSTTYGVTAGSYIIGVRSSSELYNLTATFTAHTPAASGQNKTSSAVINKGAAARGVIVPGDSAARWYKIVIPPSYSDVTKKIRISLNAQNNNVDLSGGVQFKVYYKKIKNGKSKSYISKYVLSNGSKELSFSARKNKDRTIFIRAASSRGVSGIYTISWK